MLPLTVLECAPSNACALCSHCQGGDGAGTGANAIPVVARPEGGWAPSLEPEQPGAPASNLLKASAKVAAKPLAAQEEQGKAGEPEVKSEPVGELITLSTSKPDSTPAPPAATAPVRNDGKTEIERRREAMLLREREAAQYQAEAVKQEGLRPLEEKARSDERKRSSEAASEVEPAAKCQREATQPVAAAGVETGAMKQGLQGWAERVNVLAGGDAELVRKCREFVRKRILKAHASGDLHSVDWVSEPVPTVEELRSSA